MGRKAREKKERQELKKMLEKQVSLSQTKMTKFQEAEPFTITGPELKERFKSSPEHSHLTDEQWEKEAANMRADRVYLNNLYQVNISDDGRDFYHVSIKRRDKEAVHDWRHLQQIKNELIGPSHEGVEMYPSEERLVDAANQYHLWVHKDPNFRFPWGFTERMVKDGTGEIAEDGTKQRPFDG